MKHYKHLLIIRLSALGDVAMTIPVLRDFTNQYPDVRITFLSKPFLKPLFYDLDKVNFVAADVKGRHKGIGGIFRLFRELSAMKFDAVLDLHNVLRSILLRSLFKCTFTKVVTIDKGRLEKRALTRINNKIFRQLKTTHERYADVFRSLGFKVDLLTPVFPDKKILDEEILKLTGTKKNSWVGIAPFAQYASKMYPLELMETVIKELSEASITLFLFGGGAREIAVLDSLAEKYKGTFSVAGKFNLSQELALISNLNCMLSMDSGNAHFAAMLGIPTVTVWGVTHPYTGFAPFNQPNTNAILPDLKAFPLLPCSIYGNKVFEGYDKVMYSIKPIKIIDKVNQILSS